MAFVLNYSRSISNNISFILNYSRGISGFISFQLNYSRSILNNISYVLNYSRSVLTYLSGTPIYTFVKPKQIVSFFSENIDKFKDKRNQTKY